MRTAGYRLTSIQSLRVMTFDPLEENGFHHGMTLRDENSSMMNEDHIYRLLSRNKKLAITEQTHSTYLAEVDRSFRHWYPARIAADGLMTNDPGIILCIQTADCVPIFLVSRSPRAVALIHCGWRGTAQGFASQALATFVGRYGVRIEELLAVVGPSICQSCYPVGGEVADLFARELKAKITEGQWLLDLKRANFLQLASAGMRVENIHLSPLCTRCRPDLFFSYRRQGSELRGKMISFIEVGKDEAR